MSRPVRRRRVPEETGRKRTAREAKKQAVNVELGKKTAGKSWSSIFGFEVEESHSGHVTYRLYLNDCRCSQQLNGIISACLGMILYI